jgi:hypothetical protein
MDVGNEADRLNAARRNDLVALARSLEALAATAKVLAGVDAESGHWSVLVALVRAGLEPLSGAICLSRERSLWFISGGS